MEYIERAKNFRTKKRLGQNFLIDENVIEKIIDFVKPEDSILEIGPGIGFVTEEIIKVAKYLRAVEIDEEAIKNLKTNCLIVSANSKNKCDFKIIQNDILKTDLSAIQPDTGDKLKIIANIPYYITSPILLHLLGEIDEINHKNRCAISEIILMVQLEVAKRLVADENSKNKEYGTLSILAQMWADVEIVDIVRANCFYPKPKVDSALVRLKINNSPKVPINPFLRRTIKAAFSQRRKTLKNCLVSGGFKNIDKVLDKLNIDTNIRGEKLSIEMFEKLSKELYENQN